MEKIRIGKEKQLYEIESIRQISSRVLQVVFSGPVPASWGDITIYTSGDVEATTLTGYETVYRNEGQTVYLSNDGSIYTAPEISYGPSEPPDPYVPTLKEVQAAKHREVSAECEKMIYAGVNVTLADGSQEHYSLTIEDQLNLFCKLSQINAGAVQLEYHADGQPCRYYSASDMQAIIQAAIRHVSYHTTYCNALNMWIAECKTINEASEIFYGADVPAEYQSEVLKTYLAQTDTEIGVEADGTQEE